MEDDLNFKVNGRRPQFVDKQKTTCPQCFFLMEDDLNVLYQQKTFSVNQAQLAPASPELGTAQPQIVSIIFDNHIHGFINSGCV